jgi:hypothetical protein
VQFALSQHSLEDLHMMLTSNMSARLDAVDKLLRAFNGQEAGLDRAMLQEARFVVTCLKSGSSFENRV